MLRETQRASTCVHPLLPNGTGHVIYDAMVSVLTRASTAMQRAVLDFCELDFSKSSRHSICAVVSLFCDLLSTELCLSVCLSSSLVEFMPCCSLAAYGLRALGLQGFFRLQPSAPTGGRLSTRPGVGANLCDGPARFPQSAFSVPTITGGWARTWQCGTLHRALAYLTVQ